MSRSIFSQDGFSKDGCHVVTSLGNSGKTICSCNHLTHFAVLVDYGSDSVVLRFSIRFNCFKHCSYVHSVDKDVMPSVSHLLHSCPRRMKIFWRLSPTLD